MTRKVSRRRYVQALGAASVATLAGCASVPGTDTGGPGEETTGSVETTTESTAISTESATESETATESPETTGEADTDASDADPHGNIHIHGQMSFQINDRTYELGDLPYNWEKDTAETDGTGNEHWHFHADDGSATKFHVHSEGVTLGYGLDTLPKVDAAPESLTFRDTTYDASESGTTLKYVVDGEAAGLDYVFEESGTTVEVVVESDESAPPTVTPSTPGEGTSTNSSGTNTTSESSTTTTE